MIVALWFGGARPGIVPSSVDDPLARRAWVLAYEHGKPGLVEALRKRFEVIRRQLWPQRESSLPEARNRRARPFPVEGGGGIMEMP